MRSAAEKDQEEKHSIFRPETRKPNFLLSVAVNVVRVVALLAVLGLVLYIIGRIRNRGSEEKNPIVPAKVSKYLRDTRGEFKKIVWPNFPTVVRNTGVVLAMCAVTALVIIAVDLLCGWLVDLLVGLKL